ncbi:UNVERIFIED_CONTAM: hypothetical protein FKN15_025377 [Acipenser sinensis]
MMVTHGGVVREARQPSQQKVQADAEHQTHVRQVRVTLCARCLGIQHATLALEKDVACSICVAFQPKVKENRLERATKASSASLVAGPPVALGAPKPLLHDLSQDPLLDIPDGKAPRSHSQSPQSRRVKCSKQLRDIMDLKAQLAQVQELLAKQAPTALMGRAAAFLQVPWTPVAEPRRSVFRTQAMALHPQKFPAFSDFMEAVRSSWESPASGPSVLKQAALLAFQEGAEKLSLAGFPPVDSTIAALVKAPPVGGLARDPACPNPQCRVTEKQLKQASEVEAQATHLSNTASVLTAYMDGVLREAPLPELVATELCLLSSTLLQISGLQGQALDRSLATLTVARIQLRLSQARVPDADKAALLDTPISPGHTFGPAVEEILQRSHWECETSWQVAALLPPRTPA